MVEVIILIVFLALFLYRDYTYRKDMKRDDEMRKTFENTIYTVLGTIEKTQDTFYEQTARIVTEHFKQVEKSTDKQSVFYSHQIDKFIETLDKMNKKEPEMKIEPLEYNQIEKEENNEDPLADLTPEEFGNIKNIQFEGEEEIYPLPTSV